MSSTETLTYDTQIEMYDWRYSAAIVGLIKYFKYCYPNDETKYKIEWNDGTEVFSYNQEDISNEKYIDFVEYVYRDELHHVILENGLKKEEYSEEQIKFINEKLAANVIMKKIFNKIKFDGTNTNEIKELIDKNRAILILETFKNKKNLYANFCNTNQMFSEEQNYARILGYTVDGGKKSKSVSYNFDTSTFVGRDMREFDFIIFGFTIGREAIFINDNWSIEGLVETNRRLQRKMEAAIIDEKRGTKDTRRALFEGIIESADFLNYDVEIIVKNIEDKFFHTMFLRKGSINVLKQINNYNVFCTSIKVTDDYYINVQKEVTDAIINLTYLDSILDFLMKENNKTSGKYQYLVEKLIGIDISIGNVMRQTKNSKIKLKGGTDMKQSLEATRKSAKEVVVHLNDKENKLSAYRTKLTSALVFKDYHRFCDILLQLSNYTDKQFNFAFDLYDDFEGNIDVARTFVNALYKEQLK